MIRSTKPIVSPNRAVGFRSTSYIGSEIAEFRLNNEKPPRSAKLVISLNWSWSPAHSASEILFLSAHPRQDGWTLWAKASDYDTGHPMYCRVGWGAPYKGYSPEFASKELLTAAWRTEISRGRHLSIKDLISATVDQEGLLTKSDIDEIGKLLSEEIEGE